MYPKAEAANVVCIPHVSGRELEPSPECLKAFTQKQCELACTIASEDFWMQGFCQVVGGNRLPRKH